jgi:hypothetical protein
MEQEKEGTIAKWQRLWREQEKTERFRRRQERVKARGIPGPQELAEECHFIDRKRAKNDDENEGNHNGNKDEA